MIDEEKYLAEAGQMSLDLGKDDVLALRDVMLLSPVKAVLGEMHKHVLALQDSLSTSDLTTPAGIADAQKRQGQVAGLRFAIGLFFDTLGEHHE